MGNTSFTMGLRLRSKSHERAIAAEGVAVIVMVDYRSGKKIPLSDELRKSIERLEASAADVPPQNADA
jgi:acyl-CoA thioesterase FadM